MGPAWTLPLIGSPKFKEAALATGEQHLNGVEHLIAHHTLPACSRASLAACCTGMQWEQEVPTALLRQSQRRGARTA